MIASFFQVLGYTIGLVLAIGVIAVGVILSVGVLIWLLRTALRLLFDVSFDFVPNLKRWVRRNRTSE